MQAPPRVVELAEKYNCSLATVGQIRATAEKILTSDLPDNYFHKHISEDSIQVDVALWNHFENQQQELGADFNMSCNELKDKAIEIAQELGMKQFRPNVAWLLKFRKR